jgi:hypothetical protein
MVKQADAINEIANRILRSGSRHTDGDVNMMLVTYYRTRQKGEVRRDFSRAIDEVQAIVSKNKQGASVLYGEKRE